MGYDAIRHLPDADRERDKKMIDQAFEESVRMIREEESPAGDSSSAADTGADSSGET